MSAWNGLAWMFLGSYTVLSSGIIYRRLGGVQFGMWAILVSLRGLIVFMDGGLAFGVTRDVARYEIDDSALDRIRAARRVYAFLGLAVFAVALVAAIFVGHLMHVSMSVVRVAVVTTVFVGAETATTLVASPIVASIRGRERFDVVAAGGFAQSLVGLLLLLVLIRPWGLIGAAVAMVSARLVVSLGYYRWLRQAHRELLLTARVSPKVVWQVLGFATPVWLIAIGAQLGTRTDVPIVATLYGPSLAGQYALGSTASSLAAALLFVLVDAAFPRLSASDREDASRLQDLIMLVSCGLAGLGFGMLVLNRDLLLTVWVGSAPLLASRVLLIYGLAWALNVPTHVISIAAIGRDRHRVIGPIVLGEALTNFVLSVALALRLGPLGPALGTLACIWVTNLGIIPLALRGRLRLRLTRLAMLATIGFAVGGSASGVISLIRLQVRSPVLVSLGFSLVATIVAALALVAILVRSMRLGGFQAVR